MTRVAVSIITARGRSDSLAVASTVPGRIPQACRRARFANCVHRERSSSVAASSLSLSLCWLLLRSESCSAGERLLIDYFVSGIKSMSIIETAKK